ncbi:DUF86 domain-containing protein [Azovibrio restrictus]|uniref:HepT-like ribonuclease domain-containing protein n=1 Tax=Azovibrio restrictus TaxID=146938 RepID=UPI0026F0446E|nr:DUF86 domain-containing protein [Azovibrio restrictus]
MTKAARIPDYLRHILTAIERIRRYTENMGEAEFMANELVQDAVIRNIEIIGEAANNIQRAALPFTTLHKHIPWSVMYAMRNRVCHGYDKVDLQLVWRTIACDLPGLYQQVRALELHPSLDDIPLHGPSTGP